MAQRILFFTHTPESVGAEKHLIELIRRLDESVESRILCFGCDFYSKPLHERANLRVIHKLGAHWSTFVKHDSHGVGFVKGIADIYPWFANLAAYSSGARRVVVIEQLIGDSSPPSIAGRSLTAIIRRLIGWRTRYLLGKWARYRVGVPAC